MNRSVEHAISIVIILVAAAMVLAIVAGTMALKFGCQGIR